MMFGEGITAMLCLSIFGGSAGQGSADVPCPVVEIEEDVCSFEPANNGAGPMWAHGNTCIVRVGESLFATGLEMLPDVEPLHNVRWQLFQWTHDGWEQVEVGSGRTREPCPLACLPGGELLLSDNPTLTELNQYSGPAQPQVLIFDAPESAPAYRTLLPVWEGKPTFTEHSYRSFAADGVAGEAILFQNIGYAHAEWSFLDREGNWSAQGQIEWPWGHEYPKPQPIRVCYPTVAIQDRAVYFCGVSDIVEPYPEWREYKKEITGRDWDYDFRRLFFTWSDDIAQGGFHDWIEVASRDETCGWIFPCDMWVSSDKAVHLLWSERTLDERLRDRFFPDEKQTTSLNYAVVRDGEVVLRRVLQVGGEGESTEIPGNGRFQVTQDGRLFVFYYVSGTNMAGERVSENRILEIQQHGAVTEAVTVELEYPFTSFYTATWRAGCEPSSVLDVYGQCSGKQNILSYARVRIE